MANTKYDERFNEMVGRAVQATVRVEIQSLWAERDALKAQLKRQTSLIEKFCKESRGKAEDSYRQMQKQEYKLLFGKDWKYD